MNIVVALFQSLLMKRERYISYNKVKRNIVISVTKNGSSDHIRKRRCTWTCTLYNWTTK